MKNYIFILSIISISYSCAQHVTEFESKNFEKQFIGYEPTQNSEISKKDFDYARLIITETKSAIKNNPQNFNLADYYNVLYAFLILKENENNINLAFEKFKNAEGSCEYVLNLEKKIEANSKYDLVREGYLEKLKECKQNSITEKEFDIEKYCNSNNLDLALVKRINQIDSADQKYRNEIPFKSESKQRALDKVNQKIIDSLYSEYDTYLGKSLVGEEFENVMWAVIQHSNPEIMGEYLPVIQKAVEEKELNETPLKMLIDRYYGLTYGYQIFGSQSGFGFELADEKKREKIKLKYGID